MSSMVDLPSAAVMVTIVFPVTVAVCLSLLAVLSPREDARVRAERLLLLLFGRRGKR